MAVNWEILVVGGLLIGFTYFQTYYLFFKRVIDKKDFALIKKEVRRIYFQGLSFFGFLAIIPAIFKSIWLFLIFMLGSILIPEKTKEKWVKMTNNKYATITGLLLLAISIAIVVVT